MIVTLQTLYYFRESLFLAIERIIAPYYKNFALKFGTKTNLSDDEDSDEQVFSDYDDEKGVVFFPPMYAQRYAAVSDSLMDGKWCGQLEKVVDLGYHDISFIKYLKDVPGIRRIIGVDLECISLHCSSDIILDDYVTKREHPLQITLFKGNAADPDYRLIGCDAVVAIEMIEHLLPHDLDRLIHTVFGFIKPRIAVFTTPNADFNVLFKSLETNGLRRLDHFFEWTREQFHDWCSNIVVRYPSYSVTCKGIGPGPPGTQHHGCCSQLALFVSSDYVKQKDLDLNSLSVVADAPNPDEKLLDDIIGEWDVPDEDNIITANNELNCSTLQVRTFSKTTQNMMAKHRIDSLEHTREVVDEMRQLADMLTVDQRVDHHHHQQHHQPLWHNTNWGEDAPYWNNYYELVREYNYPFEVKSEESRVLDLVTEEMSRAAERGQTGRELVALPVARIMRVVRHVTTDVGRVRELLEWNGFELVEECVVQRRLLADDEDVGGRQEEHSLSEVNTD